MHSSDELFQRLREDYFGVIYNYQNNIRVSAETVRHDSTCVVSFLARHNGLINDDTTSTFTHRPRVSLARLSSCWWRQNRWLMTSQRPHNCDATTWIVISSSLDINFIHGDIHDRSCKKIVPLLKKIRFQSRYHHKVISKHADLVSIAGTLGCVFIDNETHESGVTKCTTGEAWSAFSWHHSSVFHCQWTHNQVFLLLSHMLI